MRSKRKTAALLREYIKGLLREENVIKRLRVFDFDDTLVVTDAKVWVISKTGVRTALTPGEFAVYEPKRGETFDFTDFHQLINPRAITWTGRILRNVYNKYGPDGLVILSARSTPSPIIKFMNDIGLGDVEVKALNNADPKMKAMWIDTWIRERGLNYVEFFDDSHKNIAAVKELRKLHPDVHIIVRHVVHTHPPTHGFSKHYGTKQEPTSVQRHR